MTPPPPPTTLALCFGNRGFFPESLVDAARAELLAALDKAGLKALLPPGGLTRFNAVEGTAEGQAYARWLREQRGKYDGVILALPNFGDESGAAEALRDAGTPLYLLAWPDTLDAMDFQRRRDAFCGKLSIMDVFSQYGIRYTAWPPHTLSPATAEFQAQVADFAAACRVVRAVGRCRIGMVGARPTAFKTIRVDEVALQRLGVTVEVWDNADLLLRVQALDMDSPDCRARAERFHAYVDFSGGAPRQFEALVKVSVALDRLADEAGLDAIALRCWEDLQHSLGIAPCVVLGERNDRAGPAACEGDVCNALAMLALRAASGQPAACLDWNNNYGDDPDKCVLFHCGPVARSLMADGGTVIDHPMFAKALGEGHGFGCHVGRIRPMPFTYASVATVDGGARFYAGGGDFTTDPLPEEFFGCAGVARVPGLQQALLAIGREGYRHHVAVAPGGHARALREAFGRYLGYGETELMKNEK